MQAETFHEHDTQGKGQTTAIIIANPTAGSYSQNKHQIKETVDYLRARGWNVELKLTEGPGDGKRLTQEAVQQKLNVVIAVGGDGTINEVIQQLAGSETALGVIPGGTVNVWAREVGIPLEIEKAREILVTGQTRRIDLGQVNERYFLLMATIGLDAEVTHAVEQKPVKRFGIFGYIFLGTRLGLNYHNFTSFLQIGKRDIRTRVLQIIIGNTKLYAGAIEFTWKAKCDDGALDMTLIHQQNVPGRLEIFLDFLLRRKQRQRRVHYETITDLKIHTNRPIAIQVDGDPDGYTSKRGFPPTTIRVVPQALKVIVPAHVSEDLFTRNETQ